MRYDERYWLIQNGKLIRCTDPSPNLSIPEGVTIIGDSAFEGCNPESIEIPEGVNHIEQAAFAGLRRLKSIRIPSTVTYIGHWAFDNCTGLESIDISEGVTIIGDSAFKKCRRLKSITIPSTVAHIGDGAFEECISLKSIAIPSIVTHIGDNLFKKCPDQLLTHVCRFLVVFAKFEMHQREYQGIVYPFVAEKLALLRARKAELENNSFHDVFDIADPEEANLCFYIIRNLIRRHDAALLDDLRFLVEIPAVRALLHTPVMAGQPNELLQLAINIGNQGAIRILLGVPAVYDLADQNEFYPDRERENFDFRAAAQDRESSMRTLSAVEQQQLKNATDLYQPQLDAKGVPNVLNELRSLLLERYHANPAVFTRDDGSKFVLPALWGGPGGFKAMLRSDSFSKQEKQRAKEAYHTHEDHTAWRYLSIPNYWMNSEVSYVYVNEVTNQKWAMFEGYEGLMAMLFLAAKDENIECTKEFTIETRLEHFIAELALIGRAHNWDFDEGEQGAEYDHIHQGDRPSCWSGVKCRLLQSVPGHPLLNLLTKEIVEKELRAFVRTHFQNMITEENRQILQETCERAILFATPGEGDQAQLVTLDIAEGEIEELIDQLLNKHGGIQFNLNLQQYVRVRLSLREGGRVYDSLAVKFGDILNKLLNGPPEGQLPGAPMDVVDEPLEEQLMDSSGPFCQPKHSRSDEDEDDLPEKKRFRSDEEDPGQGRGSHI